MGRKTLSIPAWLVNGLAKEPLLRKAGSSEVMLKRRGE